MGAPVKNSMPNSYYSRYSRCLSGLKVNLGEGIHSVSARSMGGRQKTSIFLGMTRAEQQREEQASKAGRKKKGKK